MKRTTLDAWNSYHSIPLCFKDRHLTTFITPWGRHHYRTAPQGYVASGDAITRRYDELVAHIGQRTKCIDDVLGVNQLNKVSIKLRNGLTYVENWNNFKS